MNLRSCAVALAALALLVGGCADDDGSGGSGGSGGADGSNETSKAPTGSLVVLGDSIPLNDALDCPNCTGFVDSYADAVDAEAENLSSHGARVQDVVDQLRKGKVDEQLADADLVIVSFGANDQPLYRFGDQACHVPEPATIVEAVDAVAATTTKCVDQVTADLRRGAVEALRDIRKKAPEAAIVVLAPYDTWMGQEHIAAASEDARADAQRVATYALTTWRKALCAVAADVDAACVDLYTAFNGADGTQPAGDLLASDNAHPSQEGNDAIRDLLLEANLMPTSGS